VKSDKSRMAPAFAVPTGRLALAAVGSAGALAIGCGALAWFDLPPGRGAEVAGPALVGGLLTIAVSTASIFAFAPWRPRSALAWQTVWLASTVIRLMVTPLMLLSVYFAALQPGAAMFLGGVAGYGLSLLGESLVLARAAWNATPDAADSLGGTG